MNIINMEGFRQIPESEDLYKQNASSDDFIRALRARGVSIFSEFSGSPESVCRGSQTVNAVEYSGLLFTLNQGAWMRLQFPDVKKHAVQLGFRLTFSAGKKYTRALIGTPSSSLNVHHSDTEATSYYYEMLIKYQGENSGYCDVELYCNRVLTEKNTFRYYAGSMYITLGNSHQIFHYGVTGTMMVGDMYCATLPYGDEWRVEPSLLGSIEVMASPVLGFEGTQHVNTLGKDIVAGLNSGREEDGYLSLRPVTQPAIIKFQSPEVSGKKVIAVMTGVTYRSCSAPNNYLAWQVQQGNTAGSWHEELSPAADPQDWSVVTETLHAPLEGGPGWGPENMNFSLKLFNKNRMN